MDPIEQIKSLLTESIGEDETTKVVESLEAFKEAAVKEAQEEAESSLQPRVDEAVKEARVEIEAEYLKKYEEDRSNANEAVQNEVQTFEQRLASRVKSVLTEAIEHHGDRLVQIEEQELGKKGSILVEQLGKVFDAHKREIVEAQQIDPEEIEKLKTKTKELQEQLEAANKAVLEHKARANIAEQDLTTLREQIDTGVSVTIEEEDRGGKGGTPATEAHPDSDPNRIDENFDENGKRYTPEMERMRRLAGVGGK